jgi:hypothetical protein
MDNILSTSLCTVKLLRVKIWVKFYKDQDKSDLDPVKYRPDKQQPLFSQLLLEMKEQGSERKLSIVLCSHH